MQNLLDSLDEVKRMKAALDKANDAMRKAGADHQAAVTKAADLKREFDASVAELIPSIRLKQAV
jgi:hypothetical protein